MPSKYWRALGTWKLSLCAYRMNKAQGWGGKWMTDEEMMDKLSTEGRHKKIRCSVLYRATKKREVVKESSLRWSKGEENEEGVRLLLSLSLWQKTWQEATPRNESPTWGPWMVEIATRWLLVSGACGRCLLTSQSIGSWEIGMLTFIWRFLLPFFFLAYIPSHRILLLSFRGGMWSLLGMLDTMCLLGNSKSIQFDNEN